MQLRHNRTILASGDSPSAHRITAICWSPNNQKLAVAAVADDLRLIYVFDEQGQQKDKFSTKPSDPKITKPYTVCSMAFSPDSTKLAVAQTDGGVFLYKLGLEWGEKKSICNKFVHAGMDVTCLSWPKDMHNTVIYGGSDGGVRAGNLKTNRSTLLYQTESMVVSLASSPDGRAILGGHLDGSVIRFFFDSSSAANGGEAEEGQQGRFALHSSAPYILNWGQSIVVSGNDRVLAFYNQDGHLTQQLDMSQGEESEFQYEFTAAEFSPSGQTLVLGSFDCLDVLNYSSRKNQWEAAARKQVQGLYTVYALSWKPDGSKLILGTMCGAVEAFDCCLKKSNYMGKFEFTYVSSSQVIVKNLSTGARVVVRSNIGCEIEKINIYQSQFVVANTPETILIGDLASCKLSEIHWLGGGNEKFYFNQPGICLIFNAGELSILEYGSSEILGACRTEVMSPNLISIQLNPRNLAQYQKRIAFLADLQTIQVQDISTGLPVATVYNPEAKIDWLALSCKGDKLLYRDKQRVLHLYDISTSAKNTLLNYCTFVQWIQESEVIVAQSRSNLCVWYSLSSLDKVTMFTIKGEVDAIERTNGKTEVLIDEGVQISALQLDESLIEFGTALDDRDYKRAILLLERIETSEETNAMWKKLAAVSLQHRKLVIAERCFAALGDVSKCRYLREVNQLAEKVRAENPLMDDPYDHYVVRAKLAVLDKQFKLAENIYLEQGRIDEAMDMYQDLHKWGKSIHVAEMRNHPDLESLKHNYFQWLVESGQEEKAAMVKEEEGNYMDAVQLYLKGGMPGRACQVLQDHQLLNQVDVAEQVASALVNNHVFDKAGDLYEKIGQYEKALEAYTNGDSYRAAVDLSRARFPQHVVALEEKWADYLMSQRQAEAAINHYIEAGKMIKAVDAAIDSKQWKKAIHIVDSLPSQETAKPYYEKLARYFMDMQQLDTAEKYFVSCGMQREAVEMYTKNRKWDKAHLLATTFMPADKVDEIYIARAEELVKEGAIREAEKVYLTIDQADLAINMYKEQKMYDDMIRLVGKFHSNLLAETHVYLGKMLEQEGKWKDAEFHYLEGKDWKSTVNMYCTSGNFEEAYRVSKVHGGPNSAKQIAYLWAKSLGGDAAVKLLTKLSLLTAAIEFAVENGHLEFAFELAKSSADPQVMRNVQLKHAMVLEDEGKFREAEAAFLQAGKPREAILMYIHGEDWDSALRIAEKHDTSNLPEILMGQAKHAFSRKDFAKAEAMVLRAQKPETIIKWYRDSLLWKEAILFTKEYLPSKLAELNQEYDRFISMKPDGGKEEYLATAKMFETERDYDKAIDMYLKINSDATSDVLKLEEVWGRAVELSIKFSPSRCESVVRIVCDKLVALQRYDQAARLFVSIDARKDAVDLYLRIDKWEEARKIASTDRQLSEYVEAAYVRSMKSKGHAEALAGVDINAALDLFVSRNEWERCMEKAVASKDRTIVEKYSMMYVASLVRDKKFADAISQLLRFGVSAQVQHVDLYDRIAKGVLRARDLPVVGKLKEVLFKLIRSEIGKSLPPQFETYLYVAHLLTLRVECTTKKDLQPITASQAISLLRYTDLLPPDVSFYEAGSLAKSMGKDNMAFVCWNRYLDLSEAIEDGLPPSTLDNSDFEHTDVPWDVELPTENLPEEQREQVRDWILSASLDAKLNKTVDVRNCEACGSSVYAASLKCFQCEVKCEPCIVTGLPLLASAVQCSSCKKEANREDWNRFVAVEHVCPWCGSSASPK